MISNGVYAHFFKVINSPTINNTFYMMYFKSFLSTNLLWHYAERSIPISYFHLVNSFKLTKQFRTFCNSKQNSSLKWSKLRVLCISGRGISAGRKQ